LVSGGRVSPSLLALLRSGKQLVPRPLSSADK